MSRAAEVLREMQRLTKELKQSVYDLNKELSEIDRKMNDIYHEAEVNEFDKNSGYDLTIRLQTLARRRREIKLEITYFEEANDKLQLDDDFRLKIHDARMRVQKKEKRSKEYAYWLKQKKDSASHIEA
ncbi:MULTISPECIES: hypothetical protein [Priestia]|uniref:hypothetical protein n=1 Tax=Priestia TaxID=2800373 RepID=UPI00112D6228|nr:hypothetical protein [Priestia megaterium]TPF18018.1 hypothetical protein CBE78_01980 [Priestia megaterium]TPF22125.1 hypothetical protein CBE79_04485 [Priestia megaterium]